ncbi:MAG: hypothetical protein IT233_13640 [Bacteroidia bacterium]|nr:hypothetical protein [Bacteroidia bacterium]
MNYFLRLGLLCALLLLLAAVPYLSQELVSFRHPGAFVMTPLFCLFTLFQHQYLIRSTKGSPTAFIRAFMGMTVMKMLVLATAFILTLVLGVPSPFCFAGWFVLIYISFLIYEVVQLSAVLKKTS